VRSPRDDRVVVGRSPSARAITIDAFRDTNWTNCLQFEQIGVRRRPVVNLQRHKVDKLLAMDHSQGEGREPKHDPFYSLVRSRVATIS
jgi:hypothetical protein